MTGLMGLFELILIVVTVQTVFVIAPVLYLARHDMAQIRNIGRNLIDLLTSTKKVS